ncbi:MAG TPA: FtsL-like putative cell division protein [Puia sp.]|nr:FtsL-like putative cell division protein [Puia sp.]
MKQRTQNNDSTLPWETAVEEPQQISGTEASAAAAVIPGKGRSAISGTGTTGQPGPTTSRNRWQPSRLGYRWVVRNVGFLLFLTVLAVVYIYNGHYADKISRDLNRTNKEVKELQYEYKTLKSEVMFRSKESELAKAVAPFGLRELTQPPFVLTDNARK